MNGMRGHAHSAAVHGTMGAGAQRCSTQNGRARLRHARTRNKDGLVRGGMPETRGEVRGGNVY